VLRSLWKGNRKLLIKWYGHASLQCEGDGVPVVTDPHDPAVSALKPVDDLADLVVVSSTTDAYHSNATMISGDPLCLNALDVAGFGAVEVRASHSRPCGLWRASSTKSLRTRTRCTASSWGVSVIYGRRRVLTHRPLFTPLLGRGTS
jgi:Beta-lactamase superfamily domain